MLARLTSLVLVLALALAPVSGLAQTGRSAPGGQPLRARLIVRGAPIRLDRYLANPVLQEQLRALEHPDTSGYDVDPPIDPVARVLDGAVRGRPMSLDDVRQIRDRDLRRQDALGVADARYARVFGDVPRQLLPLPAVDMVLRVENTSSSPVSLRVDGDSTTRRMRLVGPGAVHGLGGGDPTEIFMVGRLATIPPGGHVDLPIQQLRYGTRAQELGAYWTAPGRYTLTVGFDTVMDARGGADPTTLVQLVAAPVSFDVV